MKLAAAVLAVTHATQDPDMINCWIANDNAPHCGCQMITREKNMIGKKCELDFEEDSIFGPDDIAMITVASSFPMPEDTDLLENRYVWTGFEGLSHENLHDIVWFFRPEICPDSEDMTRSDGQTAVNLTRYEQNDGAFNFECPDFPDAQDLNDSLPLLGNFNYDIARSHQSYNLPIYGLEAGQTALVLVESHWADIDTEHVSVRNVTAHHGHGIHADTDECDHEFTFTLNDHLGELEYVNFYLCEDPTVSKEASPGDYEYTVPSSWTTTIELV